LLLAFAGYQVASPVELTLSLLGLLSIAVGELRAGEHRPAPRRADEAEWRSYVGRLATAACDSVADNPGNQPAEAVVVKEGDREVGRIRGRRRGKPFSLRFMRRRGRMAELEATVGEPGTASPDATIERHRSWLARSPEQRLPLPRVKTGDAAFDQKLSVHGEALLGEESQRRRLMETIGNGVLILWRGKASRYRLSYGSNNVEPAGIDPSFAVEADGSIAVGPVLEILDMLDTAVAVPEQANSKP
jgi:hypothetical protein